MKARPVQRPDWRATGARPARLAVCLASRVPNSGISISKAKAVIRETLDGVASIVIGLILAATAAFLGYEARSLLTGEAVDPEVRADIRRIVATEPGVAGTNEVLTMHFGPRKVLVTLSLEFADQISATAVEEAVTRIEKCIKTTHLRVSRVFVKVQSLLAHRNAALAGRSRPADVSAAAAEASEWARLLPGPHPRPGYESIAPDAPFSWSSGAGHHFPKGCKSQEPEPRVQMRIVPRQR